MFPIELKNSNIYKNVIFNFFYFLCSTKKPESDSDDEIGEIGDNRAEKRKNKKKYYAFVFFNFVLYCS